MYACFFVPAIGCICVRIGCTPQLRSRRPPTYRVDLTLLFRLPAVLICFTCLLPHDRKSRDRFAVLKTIARTINFSVRLCWVKMDIAVSLGETPSSELVQCELWGIVWRLAVRVGVSQRVIRHSLDFTFNRLCMKLFKTGSIDVVKDSQSYFAFDLPSCDLKRRQDKFILRYVSTGNGFCQFCKKF